MSSCIERISYCENVTLITLSALPSDSRVVAEVLTAFAAQGINVDMISQTAPQGGAIRLSFTVSDRDMVAVLTLLGALKADHPALTTEILQGNGKITFSDANMVQTPGVAAQVFSLLSQADIQIMLITTSDVDISILINEHTMSDTLKMVAAHYNVTPEETVF